MVHRRPQGRLATGGPVGDREARAGAPVLPAGRGQVRAQQRVGGDGGVGGRQGQPLQRAPVAGRPAAAAGRRLARGPRRRAQEGDERAVERLAARALPRPRRGGAQPVRALARQGGPVPQERRVGQDPEEPRQQAGAVHRGRVPCGRGQSVVERRRGTLIAG